MFLNDVWYIERIWVILVVLLCTIVLLSIFLFRKNTLAFNLYKLKFSNSVFQKTLMSVSHICVITSFVLILFASMGISKVNSSSFFHSGEAYVLFVLDISPSMTAEDIGIKSRWQATIEGISHMMKNTSDKNIGIIIFSDTMSMVVPFTDDYRHIEQILKEVKLGSLGIGSALSDAVIFAHRVYESVAHQNKIVIFMTDGNQNSGTLSLNEVALQMKETPHNMILMRLGNNVSAPFKYYDEDAQTMISGVFKPNPTNLIPSFANKADIAYFDITSEAKLDNILINVIRNISRGINVEKRENFHSYDIFFLVLACAFFLVFLLIRQLILRVLW